MLTVVVVVIDFNVVVVIVNEKLVLEKKSLFSLRLFCVVFFDGKTKYERCQSVILWSEQKQKKKFPFAKIFLCRLKKRKIFGTKEEEIKSRGKRHNDRGSVFPSIK